MPPWERGAAQRGVQLRELPLQGGVCGAPEPGMGAPGSPQSALSQGGLPFPKRLVSRLGSPGAPAASPGPVCGVVSQEVRCLGRVLSTLCPQASVQDAMESLPPA